jgi:leucyl aminopeptidase
MILPAFFVPAAAPAAADAVAIHVVDRAGWKDWRAEQAQTMLAWLDANNFTAAGGAFLLVPDANGRAALVVAAINDAGDPLALAHLPMLLPAGDYHL